MSRRSEFAFEESVKTKTSAKNENKGRAWKLWVMVLLVWIAVIQLYVVCKDVYIAIKMGQIVREIQRDLDRIKD